MHPKLKDFIMKHKKKLLCVLLLVIGYLLCYCCTPRYNQPLLHPSPDPKPAPPAIKQDTQMLFATTFSGGGSRAMAMGWFVCEELSKIKYGDSTNLMQEIDMSSGVSGGAFVTAALPIYRNNWKEFYTAGVTRNIQGAIIRRMLIPWNWPWLLSPYYTRTNLASEYYDKYVFKRHTFGTIPTYPKIMINSTLLAQGTHFVYTDEYFRYIDSDISTYPLGYACAASSAFPVGFPAVTLKNYGKTLSQDSLMCDREYKRAYRNRVEDLNLYVYYRLRNFLNDKTNEWLHNQDGGLAGNTGIKRILDECKTNGIINKAINDANNPLKRLVVLVVDAGTTKSDHSCEKQRPPWSIEVIVYTTTTAMDVLSGERLAEVKSYLDQVWQVAQQSREGFGFKDNALSQLEKPYLIEISARNILDKDLSERFNKLPTSFHMNAEQLKTIKQAVTYLIENNEEYKRLVQSIRKE